MLGNKIKGVGKSQIVSIANAEETSKPMDVVALTESSDDVCHLEEASKETVDLNNKVSNLGQEISARKSSPVQIQTSLANGSHVKESEARHSPDPDDIPSENSKLGENEKSKLVEVDGHMTNFESPANVSNEVHDAVNCLIDAIDKGSLGLAEVECDDQSGIQNKSNSAESDHKVDEIVDSVVCEEDVKCLLGDSLEDKIPVHEASSTPSISPAEEGLSTLALSDHLIDPSISPTSLLDAPSMCLNSSILSQSKEPLLPNETSLQSLLPTAEANRHEKSERCKSSCTNSDAEEEDDYSNDDSENSQEFSVRPLKFSDVAKELGGQDEGLLKYDEEISSMKNKEDGKKKSFDKEREAIADPFGTWSTGLDGTNVLPSMFVGPHLPAETTGTGDGLPKNFGITSQYISE